MVSDDVDRALIALENGTAVVDLSHLRTVRVAGDDCSDWLDALLTSDIRGMTAGEAGRSLFLSATGHIRADLTVVRTGGGFVLLQEPDQPEPIGSALAPYVLSAQVELSEPALGLFSVPRDPQLPATLWTGRPSPLGGILLAVPATARDEIARALGNTFIAADREAVERHRIRSGVPRFPVDLLPTSVPAEAGLDITLVDTAKGCFPGQESVAKIRNLGHPPVTVAAMWIDRQVAPGDPVFDGGKQVGEVTSACASAAGTHVIARLRWDTRPAPVLSDSHGRRFVPVAP